MCVLTEGVPLQRASCMPERRDRGGPWPGGHERGQLLCWLHASGFTGLDFPPSECQGLDQAQTVWVEQLTGGNWPWSGMTVLCLRRNCVHGM